MKRTERLNPPLSDERLEALWRASAPRILVKERRARARRLTAVAVVVVLAGAGTGWRVSHPAIELPRLAEGQLAEGPRMVQLADERVVELGAEAVLEVDAARPGQLEVRLQHGRARFKVTKNRARVFRVLAGTTEVRVVGTTFVVEHTKDGVVVSVEEGVVEVRRGEELKRLTRGTSWAVTEPPPVAHSDTEAAEPVVEEPESPRAQTKAPHRHVKRAPSPSAPREAASGGASTGLPPAPEGPSAEDLFRAAVDARRASRPHAAAQAWSDFLASFPDDPRAGLAAFELGRIEMDVSHDAPGALRALERAVALSPTAAFTEDAMARVVQLLDQRHDSGACKAARARYLARYAQGTYASSLSSLCGE